VAIGGGSAGAHLASLATVTNGIAKYEGDGGHAGFSSDVNLAILFNGEFDLVSLSKQRKLIGAMKEFLGAAIGRIPEVYEEASTYRRLHKDCPPMLLLHGNKDICVSHEQSVAMAERLNELGVHAEVEVYDGKGHSWFNNVPDLSITMDRVERFLEQQFGVKQTPMPSPSTPRADG
jgi:acetyl esterase/lipase